MAKVFISYRRADSAASSGRIYDRLVQRFKRQNVFKDVDNIPAGVLFGDYILDSLRQCSAVLVIIGRGWLTASADDGSRRLDDPADFVRLEIETALSLGLTVIPVLVEGASMPVPASLPQSLRVLRQINAVEVRNDPDFTRDIERVVEALERIFAQRRRAPIASRLHRPSAPTPPVPPSQQMQPSESATIEITASKVEAPSEAVEATATVSQLPARPMAPPAPASPPARPRWRMVLLPALALVLIVGSLGVLLTQKIAGDASASTAHETQTAHANAAATGFSQASQTFTALVVLFPYHAAAPGPTCDKGNAPWTLNSGTSQSNLACSSSHTRFTGKDIGTIWTATVNSGPFPQSYTMSIQVSNVSANGAVLMSLNAADSIAYLPGGLTESSRCISQCVGGDTYSVNPSGIHTLSLTVKGIHITFAVDGHAFSSDTAQGAIVTHSIGLRVYQFSTQGGSTQPVSADLSNFTITPIT